MKAWNKTQTLCILSILLSFLIHATTYRLVERIPVNPDKIAQNETIEFEILDPQKKEVKPYQETKEYIRDLNLDQELENTKKEALFQSRKTRRVKKQTIASKSGLTKNRIPKKAITPIEKLTSKRKGLLTRKPLAKAPLSAFYGVGDSMQTIKTGVNLTKNSQSAISKYIPGVEVAEINSLDTDQGNLTYYTFYMRVNDKIYPRWSNNLEEVLKIIRSQNVGSLKQKVYYTKLEVMLNSKGEYQGHIVVDSSSNRMIDFAAVDAFKRAAPFINPPKGMVEDDGLIYIPFGFRLVLDNRLFARGN